MGLCLFDIFIISHAYFKNILTPKLALIVNLFVVSLNIVIVFFTTQFLSNPIIQYIILDLLGKDSTFSFRTNAWNSIVYVIPDSLLLGLGYTSRDYRELLFNRATAHAHNVILECLFEGGLLQLTIYFYFLYSITKKIVSNINKASITLFYSIIILLIMLIFENIFQKSSGMLWLLFFFAYNSNKINIWLSKKHFSN